MKQCKLIKGRFDCTATYQYLEENISLGSHAFIYENKDRSVIGFNPDIVIRLQQDHWEMHQQSRLVNAWRVTSPFHDLRKFVSTLQKPWNLFGYIAFDIAGYYYDYPFDQLYPSITMMKPGVMIEIFKEQCKIYASEPDYYERFLVRREDDQKPTRNSIGETLSIPHDPLAQKDFVEKVTSAIDLIKAGILDKIIVSRNLRLQCTSRPLLLYRAYKNLNGSGYNYLASFNGITLIGCSPEGLLKACDSQVFTNPLAGTRHRGPDPEKDQQMRAELFSDDKEILEHVYSVLVASEEMARFCKTDTIMVKPFMDIIKLQSIQHLSSRIFGHYRAGKDVFDALEALFPAITVTGKPKGTAIAQIGRIEKKSRGVYGGAFGFIRDDGTTEFAICIRTMVSYQPQEYIIQAGAGIMRYSVSAREYHETCHKMELMLKVLNSN